MKAASVTRPICRLLSVSDSSMQASHLSHTHPQLQGCMYAGILRLSGYRCVQTLQQSRSRWSEVLSNGSAATIAAWPPATPSLQILWLCQRFPHPPAVYYTARTRRSAGQFLVRAPARRCPRSEHELAIAYALNRTHAGLGLGGAYAYRELYSPLGHG